MDITELGKHIKTRRKELGISAETLAERCELTPDFIRMIERGTRLPSLQSYYGICAALNVSPWSLPRGEPRDIRESINKTLDLMMVRDVELAYSLVSAIHEKKRKE